MFHDDLDEFKPEPGYYDNPKDLIPHRSHDDLRSFTAPTKSQVKSGMSIEDLRELYSLCEVHVHTTKEKVEIPLPQMDPKHLDNMISWMERKAAEGVDVVYAGGGWDPDDFYYDVHTVYGEEALEQMDYYIYVAERLRRFEKRWAASGLPTNTCSIREYRHQHQFK